MTSVTVLPVLEAVCDQLPFGQVIEPRQLPAAVSAGIERREALVTSLQLRTQKHQHGFSALTTRNMQDLKFSADSDRRLRERVSPQRAKQRCRTAGKATTQS